MLSRFSTLFTYVIVGLVVSAAATPMGPLGDLTGDGTKALSHPGPSYPMKPYDNARPYGNDKPSPYGGVKPNPYGGDRPNPYGGDKPKPSVYDSEPYGNDEHKGDSYGQCSTGTQHCCNQVNKADESSKLESLGLLGFGGLVSVIKSSNALWGTDCSPFFLSSNQACSNKPICCQNNQMNGLVVVGCSNVEFPIL